MSEINNVRDDMNYECEYYRDRLRELLRKGRLGCIIGAVLMDALGILFSVDQGFNMESIVLLLFLTVAGGWMFAGISFAWELVNRWLSGWTIYGNILVMLFVMGLKIAFVFAISIFVYPMVLLYHLIRTQKSMLRVRICLGVYYGFIALYVIFSIITFLAEIMT